MSRVVTTTVGGFAASFLVAALLVLVGSGRANAHPGVDAARTAYDEGSFAVALARLEEAENDPGITRVELAQLYWLRGACLVAIGRNDEGVQAFDKLLEVEPLFEPSELDASPVIKSVFEERARAYRAAHEVTVGLPALVGPTVTSELGSHAQEASAVVVYARAAGQRTFKQFPGVVSEGSARGDLVDVTLWDDAGRAGALELVLEARNSRQAAVGRRGSAKEPIRLDVTAADVDAAKAVLAERAAPRQAPPPSAPPPRRDEGPPVVKLGALGTGGAFLVGALAALLFAALSGAASTAGYAGVWLYPPGPGTDVNPVYNGLWATWILGMIVAGVSVAIALLVGAGGLALLAAGLVIR